MIDAVEITKEGDLTIPMPRTDRVSFACLLRGILSLVLLDIGRRVITSGPQAFGEGVQDLALSRGQAVP